MHFFPGNKRISIFILVLFFLLCSTSLYLVFKDPSSNSSASVKPIKEAATQKSTSLTTGKNDQSRSEYENLSPGQKEKYKAIKEEQAAYEELKNKSDEYFDELRQLEPNLAEKDAAAQAALKRLQERVQEDK